VTGSPKRVAVVKPEAKKQAAFAMDGREQLRVAVLASNPRRRQDGRGEGEVVGERADASGTAVIGTLVAEESRDGRQIGRHALEDPRQDDRIVTKVRPGSDRVDDDDLQKIAQIVIVPGQS
jgi:hypothetical protein